MSLRKLFKITTILCVVFAFVHRPLSYVPWDEMRPKGDWGNTVMLFLEPLRWVAWLFHLEWAPPDNTEFADAPNYVFLGFLFWVGLLIFSFTFWINNKPRKY